MDSEWMDKKMEKGYSDPGLEASASMRVVEPFSPLLKKRHSESVIHAGSL